MAIKSLDPKIGRTWLPTVLVVTILGLAVTGVQQVRAYDFDKRRYAQETQKEQDSNERQNQLTTDLAYARSKLDSIIILVKQKIGPDFKHLASVVLLMAQQPATQPQSPGPSSQSKNQDITESNFWKKNRAVQIAADLFRIGDFWIERDVKLQMQLKAELRDAKDDQSQTAALDRYNAQRTRFIVSQVQQFDQIRPDALKVREDLLARIPSVPAWLNDEPGKKVLDDGVVSGPGSLAAASAYLQKLASLVPEDKRPQDSR